MGLWSRFSNTLRSNANALLDELEDPAKMADQAILDLEAQIKKTKLQVRQAAAYMPEDQHAHVDAMQHAISDLEMQLKAAKSKRHALVAQLIAVKMQARRSRSAAPAYEQTNALADDTAFSTFDRMAEQIDFLEEEAKTLQELSPKEETPEHDNVNEKLKELHNQVASENAAEKEMKAVDKRLSDIKEHLKKFTKMP